MRLIRGSEKDPQTKRGEKKPKYRLVIGGTNGILLCLERKAEETKVNLIDSFYLIDY
jgi:hypothetical protein